MVAVFVNFIFSVFSLNILSEFLYSYFLDIIFISEFIVAFYIISSLGEDFIDYDEININYLDIDLVSFFNFSLLLIILSVFFLSSHLIWGAAIVAA